MKVGIAVIEGYSFTDHPVELGTAGLAEAAQRAEQLGFDLLISPETAGHDPFFPLVLAAEHTSRIELATGVAVSFPRAPMVVAQSAWDLQRFSGGRFTLGLGTQVKGHNERRYGVPWTGAPGPRMREYLDCLRAIFYTFQHPDDPRYFEGEHYRFTLAAEVFMAAPLEHPRIPLQIAAVNRYMLGLAGEVCDSVFVHPCCTPRYLREVVLPTVAEGAQRAGRSAGEVAVVGAPIVVTADNEEDMARERVLLKRRVAFYGSTRSYHRVFEVEGVLDLAEQLHEMSREKRWREMEELVPDDVADLFGCISPPDAGADDLAEQLTASWGGLLDTLNLPSDFPLAGAKAEQRAADLLTALHAAR
ncbi:MAG TPA: TIGR03617 family F420-dependent LLM class oxidoreductase [Deltaproteobacteria bacterium]|nr:TIGR03617 family F420-dependent LLM class oxidoreductase [Candidatus Binatota bacterium]HIL13632.1 TIGR03617 family F420-dependent LLM class oxidoreductase [Deltaproteobacteria bacterium]